MANCEKHGEYEAKTIKCLGLEITMSCPKCSEENSKAELEREEYERNRAEIARISLWTEKANIPTLYNGLTKFDPLEAQKTIDYNYRQNLVIVGGVGTGKTMYASWIGLMAIHKGLTVRYLYASDIATRVKDTWSSKVLSEKDVIDELINCDILILDEIGRVEYNDYLFKVIDGRYQKIRPTILLGNIEAKELPKILGDAISSRLRKNVKVLSFGDTDLRRF